MVFEKYESSVQCYGRSFPAVFSKAIGSVLYDEQGRKYIDFLAGAGSLNYGHNDPHIIDELIKYLGGGNICHSLDLYTVAKREFLESFNDLILRPRKMNYVLQFTGPTGTNAVEAALKLARKVTGRTKIISFTNAFHGVTLGALALAGNSFYRNAAGVSTQDAIFLPYDGYFGNDLDASKMLDKLLTDRSSGTDLPAAVILETVQGEGGVNVASKVWLTELASICEEYDILLIVDDIQAGCGRTGTFFSFEEYGIHPDIVVLSKSLSGSGLPMSLLLVKPEADQWKPGEHNGTFRGNNPAFITATASLKKYWSDEQLQNVVVQRSFQISKRLQQLTSKVNIELYYRGRGMIQGIVCPNGEIASAISQKSFKNGLIVETCGEKNHVLKLLMPLTTPDELLHEGLDIIEASFESLFGKKPVAAENDDLSV